MNAKFTVRSEVDFIALAPVVLGFQPEHSLVMLTVDKFTARVDLPENQEGVDLCVSSLLEPSIRHGVHRVAFLIYDEGDHPALKEALIDSFMGADITVLCGLEVGDGKYREFGGEWVPLDISDHPFVLEAQYLDIAPRQPTRAELEAHVKPSGETWSGDAEEAVELLRDKGVDAIISALTRENAKLHADLWIMVLRGCEAGSELVSDVAIVLTFAAWLSGDGALAWIALDHVDKSKTWHTLLQAALDGAMDPNSWSGYGRAD